MNAPSLDLVIQLFLSVILIVGVYQFYFWCQRNHLTKPHQLRLPIDDAIPFHPRWVWIYSCLYYPVIVYLNFVTASPRHFLYLAMSYIVLLIFQMLFFVAFPVTTPAEWRLHPAGRGPSARFLAFVQRYDASSNSFPSMHTSVAMLTALHLLPHLGAWAFAFPVLIALSCVFTKQHYVLDLPAGAALGWMVFQLFRLAYGSP
jgi:membrane-associated phospholipid phosphatase